MNRTKFFVVLGFAMLAGVGSGIAEAAIVGYARPGVITAVRDIDTRGKDAGRLSLLHNGGLANNVLGFVDRADQKWAALPPVLLGADYIQSAQDNADDTDDGGETMEMEVDVVTGTILHMFIDSRFGSGVRFPWMTLPIFGSDWIDSGETVNGDELAATGSGDVLFKVWSTAGPLNAGTYTFRQQPTDGSFYGIAATSVVPEPATLPLFGLALAVFVAHRSIKRNRRQQR